MEQRNAWKNAEESAILDNNIWGYWGIGKGPASHWRQEKGLSLKKKSCFLVVIPELSLSLSA
ncbi:MAG: hypothetical protein IJT75_03890 [Bacteroidaceae bacterium]|nr:hypothetical protein [Bacteroidaceae bacterium]